jgi:hypothetical protein
MVVAKSLWCAPEWRGLVPTIGDDSRIALVPPISNLGTDLHVLLLLLVKVFMQVFNALPPTQERRSLDALPHSLYLRL